MRRTILRPVEDKFNQFSFRESRNKMFYIFLITIVLKAPFFSAIFTVNVNFSI